jgi:hypothetical protein
MIAIGVLGIGSPLMFALALIICLYGFHPEQTPIDQGVPWKRNWFGFAVFMCLILAAVIWRRQIAPLDLAPDSPLGVALISAFGLCLLVISVVRMWELLQVRRERIG